MTNPTYDHHFDDQTLDAARLTPIVRQALGRPDAVVTRWEEKSLYGIGGGIGGNKVLLLSGEADASGERLPWRLVLKTLRPQSVDQMTGPHYWLREVEVYRSDFTATLTGQLTAPRCYGVEQSDAECWLWLEFVEETAESCWTNDQFLKSARHLGEFNGAYLTGESLPVYPWMSQDWHRKNLAQIIPLIEQFRGAGEHPLYQQGFRGDAHAYILDLWEKRETFLKGLDGLPQTICHYDAFRRNLLASSDKTVALDWSFVGTGPVGADLAAMLWVSFVFNNLSTAQLEELYQPAFDAYLEGLREAGWNGEQGLAWLGYTASFPVRVLVSAGYDTLLFLDEGKHARFEAITGLPIRDYMSRHVAAVQPMIRRIAEDAKRAGFDASG
jgi:hypothetical protein